MKKVVIGMSGGVDSSVAAIKLKEQGYEVIGVSFRFTEEFDDTDAKKVANLLGIEHHTLDYRKEFKEKVIDKFLDDYKNGLTPNPCVNCNKVCKFKFLFDCLDKFDCDYIATGHYAKIEDSRLFVSVDENKDQSYFLYSLPKDRLNKIIFPLEGKTKDEIRDIARIHNLENSDKKDSFDVCFITDSFRDYMKSFGSTPGDVVNIDTNEVIGKHIGLMYYTIGQRRGLDIGGTEDRMFVVGKDLKKNILYICIGSESDYLISDSCIIDEVNYLGDEKVTKCTAKFRYRQKDNDVELEYLDNGEILVKYPQGVKSVTPGQACVLYNGEECLGGGIIKEVRKDGKKLWYL